MGFELVGGHAGTTLREGADTTSSSLRPAGLPPYHQFTKFGEHFVYLLNASRFFRVDPPAYRLLELCLEMPINEAKQRLTQESNYNPD